MLGGVTPDELPVGHDPRQTDYEVALINRYFEKARRWREGEIDVPRRALLDLNFAPDDAVGGPDAYSHLAPIVGIDRMFSRQFDANAVYDPLNPGLSSNTAGWLFGFGAGPGYADFQTCAGVLQPQAFDQASGAVRTVFNALSGSFFADWDRADNLLRSVIAARGYAITSMAGGRPAPLLHTLAMGETFPEHGVFAEAGGDHIAALTNRLQLLVGRRHAPLVVVGKQRQREHGGNRAVYRHDQLDENGAVGRRRGLPGYRAREGRCVLLPRVREE